VIPGWVLARVLVVLAVVLADVIYYQADYTWFHSFFGFERGLMSWDADWYLRIARGGYDALPVEGLRYFPLYPLAARLLAAGGPYEKLTLLLLANAFALVAGILIYRLVLFEKKDARLARRSAWLISLAPPAFVLAMAYTEPLSLTFAIAVIYFARTGRWNAAALAGLGAGLVRPTGLLLLAPLAIEAARQRAGLSATQILQRVVAFASPLIGTGMYLWWSSVATGDALLPLTVQQRSNARGDFQFPLLTFWQAVQDLVTEARVDQGLHLVWVAILVALIVRTFRQWPVSYGAFATVSLLQAISTTNLNSLERYGYGAFPLVLAAASMTEGDRAERILLVSSAVAMTAYATAAFMSGYVP
jgi:Gpi18-like mannosyltransferase